MAAEALPMSSHSEDATTAPARARLAGSLRWPVVAIPGLTLDTLGGYLASLGLVRIATRHWPQLRACWRDESFAILNGPKALAELLANLKATAANRAWTPYERNWKSAQESDTKAKTTVKASLWRSQADETEVALFDAHLVLGGRRSFNPLLGHGGSTGRRSFADGWLEATAALANPKVLEDVSAALAGCPQAGLDKYNAGSWFSAANKAYNSGTNPYREGQVSPWAMALACEGLVFFRGGTSRQLGSRRQAGGAFPFVLAAAAAEDKAASGKGLGEVWAPVWARPMSVSEIEIMFSRGRAAVGGRGATTPAAFSAAIMQRGVDAGMVEFRRYVLEHTTSQNAFESRLASVVAVRARGGAGQEVAVTAALRLRDGLPKDTKKVFVGRQGLIDRTLVSFAERRDAAAARGLVDALVQSLGAADRNSAQREHVKDFQLLPGPWMAALTGEHETASPEIRVALAIASISPAPVRQGAKPTTAAFLAYWLGVAQSGRQWAMPKSVPFRRVWGGGNFIADAGAVLQRRLREVDPQAAPPFKGRSRVGLNDVEALLDDRLDTGEINRWAMRFSLFATGGWPPLSAWNPGAWPNPRRPLSPSLALYVLLKPCFDAQIAEAVGVKTPVRAGSASAIAALLARSDCAGAVQSAKRTLRAAGLDLADGEAGYATADPARLLASLLVPVHAHEIARPFRRWLSPARLDPGKEIEL